MKRPGSPVVRRPRTAGAGTARSRKEAAIQLLRLEFDISRLEQALAQAERRAGLARSELAVQMTERKKLMALLRD